MVNKLSNKDYSISQDLKYKISKREKGAYKYFNKYRILFIMILSQIGFISISIFGT